MGGRTDGGVKKREKKRARAALVFNLFFYYFLMFFYFNILLYFNVLLF